ncbi:peptidoglycan recognition protein family protein [Actinopolyspora mortivallis]|uniref:Peptidoglycan recognition protein family domain-containing protein n=1 Tax=Actinopolyspora mortivallis TaxID=33906 RepID=A0A2T0GV62_ACTMO|nr:peptidoglycan recognition protein [Actinopolyspora mortivallis]PRW63005.1 hypothetical protein CEP50_12490 [Actinopolyspora mortivallis]
MFRALATATVVLTTTALLTAATTERQQDPARTDPERTTAERVDLSTAPRSRAEPSTRTVRTRKPFSMVALTWSGPAPDRMLVRPHRPGGRGEWHRLAPLGRDTPTGTAPPTATRARWIGPTTAVRIRAQRAGRDVTGRLRLIAISPAATPVETAPEPRGPRPPVVTRADWGADESVMRWPPEYAATTRAAVIHHTVETNDYTCADSARVVRGLYHYHAVELGWGDIGYQVLVDKCGTLFEGRTDGLDRHVVGGHTRGFNAQTFGVALIGNFQTAVPSGRALRAAGAVAGWKLGTTGRDPRGETTLVSGGGQGNRYPEGTAVRLPRIFSHRDVGETACPGEHLYARLDRIREHAADRAG